MKLNLEEQEETIEPVEKTDLIYGIDDRPPFKEALFAALQHLLAIFVAIITPPLIIAGALKLDLETTGFLVSMALFASGVSTFIQCRRIGPVGAKLLCIQGTSFSFIGPIITAGLAGGLPLIFGACIAAAPIEMVISRTFKYMRSIITPLVSGIVVLLIVGRPETVTEIGDLSYSFIKVIPYLLVLILALVGMNVFLVLTIGIFAAGIVGIATGAIDLAGFAQAVYNGFCGMNEVFFLTLLCGGMSELIAKNGGIEWIIQKLGKVMKGNKSAQVGIAAMVSLCDCATANNTVAIIVAGDMAREVSHEYKVDPRRTASLLDMFSCVFQGIIPYGAQLLVASSLCNATVTNGTTISAANILGSLWYCWFLAAFGILSIFIPFADGICRKDPWNWEYDCAESNVAAKKALLEKEAAEAQQ